MSTRSLAFVQLILIALLLGCAANRLEVELPTEPQIPLDEGEHRLFLVGDAGEYTGEFQVNMKLLRRRIESSSTPATVVYLGDNIYPVGLPNKGDSAEYKEAAHVLNAQMDAVFDVADEVIFIPGNHDWAKGHKGGLKAIRRQYKFIKESGKARMLPKKGCGGPEVVELTDKVAMIILDSQWWLQDWRTEQDINDDCDFRSRAEMIVAFSEILKDYQEQRVIVAMHHPLISSGPHGGYYTFKDHMFPLTNLVDNLYIPLPVLGSIYPIFRSNIGNVQDQAHHRYHRLKQALLEAARFYDNVVFVAGHEHTLEYHQDENHHFLVSGSGCKDNPIGKPGTMAYGHSATGFMQLNLKNDGALDLLIWESGLAASNTPAYRKQLTPGVTVKLKTETFQDINSLPDTMDMPISTRYDKGGFHRLLFGNRYREVYDIPVPARVVDMMEEDGGLTPIKKGGGFQTNSLRVETPDERQYTARSMNKDASKLLPESLQNTFASDILQDQFTASHPYAAFIIPDMASKAGIYHTNPELVFVPKQEPLGRYNEAFGDKLYLLEERPSEEWCGISTFGECDDIVSYIDVVEEMSEDYRNQVDQEFTARNRLFDFFLGDWDRHDDQWRWAKFDRQGKGHLYRPIPRDRDQAFANYDGLVINLAKVFVPNVRKLGQFGPEIKSLKWFNDNGKIFDRDFTNKISREEWVRIAEEVKAAISDSDIEKNVGEWPAEVYAEGGKEIIENLKLHRDRLPEYANTYYEILAKTVFIRCTNNADYIEIEENPGQVSIKVYDSNKKGDKKELYYNRTFVKQETKEIQVYALEGHDNIEIRGKGRGGITVHVVGGEDEDKVIVTDESGHGRIKVQDSESRVDVVGDQKASYRKVSDDDNIYVRQSFLYDYTIPKVIIGGNPDDGFLLGGGAEWVNHGFQKLPYKSKHVFGGFYAFATSAYGLRYSGEWIDVIGKLDVGVIGTFDGPTFTQNYFGYGNDAEKIDGENRDFYRVRKRGYSAVPFLRLGQEHGSSLRLHFGVEGHEVERTEDRFVSTPEAGLPEDVFDENRFGVVRATYQYRILDSEILTRRGIDFNLAAGLDIPLHGENDAHRYVKTSLAAYFRFKHLGGTVFATRVGAEWHGGDYQFYQAAALGGQGNFRGMDRQRFIGDDVFYHNNEFRIPLTKWGGYVLPASLGVFASFDYGRVWYGEENSDTWHYAYGGGIWLNLIQTLVVSMGYHKSDVEDRFAVQMGFLF